jgi:hypothetical protein
VSALCPRFRKLTSICTSQETFWGDTLYTLYYRSIRLRTRQTQVHVSHYRPDHGAVNALESPCSLMRLFRSQPLTTVNHSERQEVCRIPSGPSAERDEEIMAERLADILSTTPS